MGAIRTKLGARGTIQVTVVVASICLLIAAAPSLSAESSIDILPSTVPTFTKLYRNLHQGSTVDTSASDIAATPDGGSVAAGVTPSPTGYPVGWVVKLDPSGSAQWSVEVGGPFTYPTTIEATPDGGAVVAGGTQGGSGAVCDPLSGRECAWITKLDAGGTVQWQKVYATGASSLQVAWEVQPTADGGYLVAGTSGHQTEYGAWIAKLDPSGDVEWQRVFGGTSKDDLATFESVEPTVDGGAVAAGWNTAGYDSWGVQQTRAFVVRLAPGGEVLWQTQYSRFDGTGGDIGGSRAESIVEAHEGGYLLGGSWTNLTPPAGADFLLIKLDTGGNVEWQRAYDGGVACYDYIGRQCARLGGVIYDVRRSPDGGYMLSGIGHPNAEPFVQAWLGKVDSSGNFLWQNTFFGTSTANAFYGVGATADGGVVAIGTMTIYEPNVIQNALYMVRTDANGNIAGCGDVHGGVPLVALDPSLVAEAASLPISTVPGSSAPASGSPLQTSVSVTQRCGAGTPDPKPPTPPGKKKKR